MYHYENSHFAAPASTGSASLAEIISAFTFALDLTEGQPQGHSLRSCYIGTHLVQHLGLNDEERWTIYYAVMLKDLGCSSNAARIAEIYLTDDRQFKHDYKLVGTDLTSVLKFVFARTAEGQSLVRRMKAIGNILKNGDQIARSLIETRCTRGADIARRLRFPDAVAQSISGLDEHWNGGGKPLGLAGEAIPLGSRIALLAQIADVFFTSDGPDAARAEVASRSGTWLDPELCDAFLEMSLSDDFWAGLAAEDIEARLVALEPPGHFVPVDEDYLDDIALAFGQVIDAKSPYTGGHSERVGDYCDLVAAEMGLDPAHRRRLRRAAILHDVGKLGVSSAILEKPGKLDADEWHVMQGHAHFTTQILGRIGALSDMALIAGSHHERLDGAGYPLQLDARLISIDTRIISVCDFFDALTADRPYRSAMPVEKALSIMAEEVGKALDVDCFAALAKIARGGIQPRPLPDISALHGQTGPNP